MNGNSSLVVSPSGANRSFEGGKRKDCGSEARRIDLRVVFLREAGQLASAARVCAFTPFATPDFPCLVGRFPARIGPLTAAGILPTRVAAQSDKYLLESVMRWKMPEPAGWRSA